ncbi:hypothetical protein [Ornithinibacillus xuwenensis]|uniref:Uncharacterized protein n=1 Tax=Ornithinibacillus xuwenensis TaxID=3144668 RepID=A0ABU9XC02_9BACI
MEEIQESVEKVEEVQEIESPPEPSEPNIDEIREQIKQVKASEYDVDDQPTRESESETDNETGEETEEESAQESELFTVKVDGEEREVSIDDLKENYSKGENYTRKMQELADEKKQFEAQQEEYEPTQKWMEYWTNNPYLKEQIMNVLNEWEKTSVLPLEPLDKVINESSSGRYINHLILENARLKDQLEDVNGKYNSTVLDTELSKLESELKAEYEDLADDEYLSNLRKQAEEEGLTVEVLKRIAKGELADKKIAKINEDNAKKQKEIEAETIKNIQKNKASSTGALGQEEGMEQVGFSQMSKKQQREIIEKVKRGELKHL